MLQGTPGAEDIVPVYDNGVPPASRNGDGDDLLIKNMVGPGGGGALVAENGEFVALLPGQTETLGDALCRFSHVQILIGLGRGLHRAPLGGHHAIAAGGTVHQVHGGGGVLDAAGHSHFDITGFDQHGAQRRGGQRGGAAVLYIIRSDGGGVAQIQRDILAGRFQVQIIYIGKGSLFDGGGVNAGALHGGLEGDGAQLFCTQGCELAFGLNNRCAGGAHNDGVFQNSFFHYFNLLSYQTRSFSGTFLKKDRV